MARDFSMTEELASDNNDMQQLADDALEALDEGRMTDLRTILERMANPKWWAAWHCKEQYELEMGR